MSILDRTIGTSVTGSTLNAVQGDQFDQSRSNSFYFQIINLSPSTLDYFLRDLCNAPRSLGRFDKFCERVAFNPLMHYPAPKCLPNTRVDVIQEMREWFGGVHNPPICWLRGPPGSGKSAIAHTIAEQYETRGKLAASYFFGRGSTNRRDITDFVPTIAFQLSNTIPQTKALMQTTFERDPSIPNETCEYQFEKLIVDPLLELGEQVSRRVIVLDGLDQYDGESWVEDLIILLTDACRKDRFPLRFCLTSRVDHHDFVGLPDASMKCIYSLSLEKFDAHGDIRTLFEAEFEKIHRKNHMDSRLDVPGPWLSHSSVDRLVAKSSGLFQFASIIIKFVGVSHLSYLKLQAVLTSLDGGQLGATSTGPYVQLFVDYLVSLLASYDVSIQAAAIKGLESVTMHSGAEAAVNPHAISSLVTLLQSEHESLLVGACRVLANIAANLDSARTESLNANATPSLIHLLSSTHIPVQRSAILALMRITLHYSATSALPVLNAIPVFASLLSSQDISIQAAAAAVLRNITVRGGVEDVVKAKAIPSLVNLLESSNAVLLIAACATLKDITTTFNSAQAETLDANAITPLIRLLSFNDFRVQRSAAFVLMCITLHESATATALPLDLIDGLVRLLGSDDIYLQASAAATLENIVVRGGAEDAMKAKAIPSLVNLLTSESTHSVVLIAVCAALKSITLAFNGIRLDANAISSLRHLCFSDNPKVQASAQATLASQGILSIVFSRIFCSKR